MAWPHFPKEYGVWLRTGNHPDEPGVWYAEGDNYVACWSDKCPLDYPPPKPKVCPMCGHERDDVTP